MNHEEWKERLSEYLDGELPEGELRSFEAHLASCPSCRGELREWEGLRVTLLKKALLPTSAETESFVRRTMARIPGEEPEEAPLDYRWFAPALGLGFAALLLSFYPMVRTQTDPVGSVLLADAGSAASSGAEQDVVRLMLEGK